MKMILKNLLFKERSKEKEILDLGPIHYSSKEYIHCQKILFQINKILGFFSCTKKFLKQCPPDISVLDVGCGGGLFVLNMSKFFPDMHFTGCDISQDAIDMAKEESSRQPTNKVTFYLQQQLELNLPQESVDIILATLVCHHLEDEELIVFFQKTFEISRKAVFINDLHRHSIPYYFYKVFSPLSKNRLINHDGLISIKRGFTQQELTRLLKKTNIHHFTIKWRFPFCWNVILWKK